MRLDTKVRFSDDWASNKFTPTGPADTELEWFFTMADSAMGVRSNYDVMVGNGPPDSVECLAEAARARRTILDRLTTIGDRPAGVLYAAYDPQPWPLPLREALGRLTGVVVRLGSAQGGTLPDDTPSRTALDRRTADHQTALLARQERAAFAPLEVRARVLLREAVLAYEHVRGGPARPILRGVTS